MKAYDREKLLNLLRDFHNLTNMKICIYDSAGKEICYYPVKLSGFCARIREDAQLEERCRECDRAAFSICKRTREQYSYTCHAGLLECVSPVLHLDKLIGYIVIGQIKPHDDFKLIERDLPAYLRAELAEEFLRLPTLEMNKIRSAMRILDACTGYEYLRNAIGGEATIDVVLDEYINANLERDLSVSQLCSHFRLSHSELYGIFKEYFGSTPAEYIKTRRLAKATKLLKDSDESVGAIAKQCGIGDYNYFSKIFKATFGKSPREYRKESRA